MSNMLVLQGIKMETMYGIKSWPKSECRLPSFLSALLRLFRIDWFGASTYEQSPKLAAMSNSVKRYLIPFWISFKLKDVTHVGSLDLDIFAAGRRGLFARHQGQQVALRRVSPDAV